MNCNPSWPRSPTPDPYPSRGPLAPKLIPRKDPVTYSPWHPSAPLTKAQLKSYEQNGFLCLKGMFSPGEIKALQDALDSARQNPQDFGSEEVVREAASQEVRSIFRVHRTDPVFSRLATDKRLLRVAEFLLGEQVYIYQSRINFKPGFFGREFDWHSDFETWHVEDGLPRMRTLSMSIAMTENTTFNGSLMFIPSSHKTYISCKGNTPEEHYKSSLKKQEIGVPDGESIIRLFRRGGIVNQTGAAGTVTIFDCNLLHGSNINLSPLPRSNVFFVYNGISNLPAEPFGGGEPRPEFLATRKDIKPLKPVNGI